MRSLIISLICLAGLATLGSGCSKSTTSPAATGDPTIDEPKVRVLSLQSQVRSLALSPDDKMLICGTDDDKISIWDLATGKLKLTVKAHNSQLGCVAFSPDGKIVASAGRRDYGRPDGTTSFDEVLNSLEVKFWDAQTLNLKRTLDCHGFALPFITFSPDSKTLAAAVQSNWGIERDGIAQLWDVETGKHGETLWHDIPLQKTYIESVAFSPDGKMLASATWSGVMLWNLDTKKVHKMIRGHEGFVTSVIFSPDGETVVSGGGDGR